ncbi:MAG TPA: putative glycoside hydrolase [Gemmatimonadaceae bacterium]|nr:putative glycoside hydrolase [Gemmatimonadaceae bacterium]
MDRTPTAVSRAGLAAHAVLVTIALVACGSGAAAERPAADTTKARTDSAVSVRRDAPPIVRGLYLNRFAVQSPKRMRELIAIADSTEINAFVLDIKDEFGLNYASKDPAIATYAGRHGVAANVKGILDTLRAHGIVSIARLVVFKDPIVAALAERHTIRRPDGGVWRDKQGLAWVNPYDPVIQEYNIKVAEEMARLGFDEIQFDYIRFPEPFRSLPQQVFPGQNGVPKSDALAAYLKRACDRVHAAGARCTADVFGLVTTVPGALEVAQQWEKLSPVVDVILPMTYPSHYPPGSFGFARPNAEPRGIQFRAIDRARQRDEKLGITTPEHVRPWLQAFSLTKRSVPQYGPKELEAQKQGVYDAGYDGWILWHAGSRYEAFVPGLERETVTRKKSRSVAADSVRVAP